MNAVKLAKAYQSLGTHHILHPESTYTPSAPPKPRATQCPKCYHIEISTVCRYCKVEKQP